MGISVKRTKSYIISLSLKKVYHSFIHNLHKYCINYVLEIYKSLFSFTYDSKESEKKKIAYKAIHYGLETFIKYFKDEIPCKIL